MSSCVVVRSPGRRWVAPVSLYRWEDDLMRIMFGSVTYRGPYGPHGLQKGEVISTA